MAEQPITDYNKWVMHLHVGKRKTPLTVYPTNDATRVTVMYGKLKWEHILVKQAERIVGHHVMVHNGDVSL